MVQNTLADVASALKTWGPRLWAHSCVKCEIYLPCHSQLTNRWMVVGLRNNGGQQKACRWAPQGASFVVPQSFSFELLKVPLKCLLAAVALMFCICSVCTFGGMYFPSFDLLHLEGSDLHWKHGLGWGMIFLSLAGTLGRPYFSYNWKFIKSWLVLDKDGNGKMIFVLPPLALSSSVPLHTSCFF